MWRKVFLCSTPKITGMSRVEAAFEEGDQRRFWVPCPHCRREIQNHEKQWMLRRGEWRKGGPGDGRTAGFHLSSLYSPVGWFAWSDAAKQFEQAQKNPSLLQVFVNTVLGETWTLLVEVPELAEAL